jgi:hypothetical protein
VQQQMPTEEQACPMWRLEVEFWRKNPKTGLELQELNHTMAECRYLFVNLDKGLGKYVQSHRAAQTNSENKPRKRDVRRTVKRGPLRFGGPAQSRVHSEFGRAGSF